MQDKDVRRICKINFLPVSVMLDDSHEYPAYENFCAPRIVIAPSFEMKIRATPLNLHVQRALWYTLKMYNTEGGRSRIMRRLA